MLPRSPINNCADESLVDPKLSRQRGLRLAFGVSAEDLKDLILAEFGVWLAFPAKWIGSASSPRMIRPFTSSFAMPIIAIIAARSRSEMVRVEARRIVAGVHHYLRIWRNFSVDYLVSQPMDAPVYARMAHHAISLWSSPIRPFQACIGILMGRNHGRDLGRLAGVPVIDIAALMFNGNFHALL